MVAEGSTKETRAAARFFWTWLFGATAVSVAGNVAHAVLKAPPGMVRLAAVASIVAPVVLLGSTHGVGVLVKARRVGFAYWCALATTLGLAAVAFILSFDALRDLAVTLGMAPSRAWLWPVAIDMSIANSTLSLLSLSPPRSVAVAVAAPAHEQVGEVRDVIATAATPQAHGEQSEVSPPRPARPTTRPDPPQPASSPPAQTCPADQSRTERVERPLAAVEARAATAGAGVDIKRWRPAADELVRAGVTSKDPAVVAAVLAENAAGTAPSTIGRRHNLHHSTVGRIVASAHRRGMFNRLIAGAPALNGVDLSESPAAC